MKWQSFTVSGLVRLDSGIAISRRSYLAYKNLIPSSCQPETFSFLSISLLLPRLYTALLPPTPTTLLPRILGCPACFIGEAFWRYYLFLTVRCGT